jgi:malonyl CoA-acyl carrier protein transacylase
LGDEKREVFVWNIRLADFVISGQSEKLGQLKRSQREAGHGMHEALENIPQGRPLHDLDEIGKPLLGHFGKPRIHWD